ncbi:uncharacterized protein LOC143911526 [Arctopsyche grandis]|uniref:uncharacterized protein LOC143911526 n=1 Tax=Arctopsyche grandis TaxID=121162 RepID=UPI00406D87D4
METMECRLCLGSAPAESSVSIFGDLHPERLEQRIRTCCQIQVERGDGLPDTVCLSCKTNLELLINFRKACFRSNETSQLRLNDCLKIKTEEVLLEDVVWSKDRELSLLECFQAEPILWQSKHKDYKKKNLVHNAWKRIGAIMCIPLTECKKKKDSLMSSYRGYKKKVKDSIHSGAGSSEVYKPIWFAYDVIGSFLGEGLHCKEMINSERSSVNDNEERSSSRNIDSQNTVSRSIRRQKNPPELLTAEEVVKDAHDTLITTLSTREFEEDDECDLHGKIVAKMLRKLPEDERTKIVCEIYYMFMHYDQLNRPQTPKYFSPSTTYDSSPNTTYSYTETTSNNTEQQQKITGAETNQSLLSLTH